jgi:hypothetical protein
MGPKLDQNDSLCQLSTKECSKFREAVETGQAKVEDLEIISRQSHNTPGSGYVGIIKEDGSVDINGFISPVSEELKQPVFHRALGFSEGGLASIARGAAIGAVDGSSGQFLSSAQTTPWGEMDMEFARESQNLYGGKMEYFAEPSPPADIDDSNMENFEDAVDEYFKQDGDGSKLGLYEKALNQKSQDIASEYESLEEYAETELDKLPAYSEQAVWFEADLKSNIEDQINNVLSGEEQATARELLDGSRNIKDLVELHVALMPTERLPLPR